MEKDLKELKDKMKKENQRECECTGEICRT